MSVKWFQRVLPAIALGFSTLTFVLVLALPN